METTITISTELKERLNALAESKHISVDQLAEALLTDYLADQEMQLDPIPSDEEIEAVKKALREAKRPGSKRFTTEEILEELKKHRAMRQVNQHISTN